MRFSSARGFVGAAAILIAAIPLAPSVAAAGSCPTPFAVAVDTTGSQLYQVVYDARTLGETFVAEQTLISAITVFRTPVETPLAQPLTLFLSSVDSEGVPISTNGVEGPTSSFPPSDAVHPAVCRFEFDPPYELPRPGTYFFSVRAGCTGSAALVVQPNSPYTGGQAWLTKRSFECVLSPVEDGWPDQDLAFTIEFCPLATPTTRSTWGRLKQAYR